MAFKLGYHPDQCEHCGEIMRGFVTPNTKYCSKRCIRQARDKRRDPARNLMHRYGMTPEDLHVLREAQAYACALCRKKTKLEVDHDHATGLVRGLLCRRCNSALGTYERVVKRQPEFDVYLRPARRLAERTLSKG